MKKLVLVFLCIALLCSPTNLKAATEAQKQAAIDAGLAYLASTQNPDGSWSYGGYEQAATGAALFAFVEQKYKTLGWNGQDYSAVVTNATNYLLSTATPIDISTANWWGFTGKNNSGIGLEWGVSAGEATYTSGIVVPALCRLTAGIVTPGTVISSANAAVNGLTYAQVIQRAADTWIWGQTGPSGGNYDGGWHYFPSQGDADGSTSQWGALALLSAQQVPGIVVPAQTKTELQKWINYIQNPDGSCGYQSPTQLNDESKTGGLLTQMVFAGGGGSQSNALAYLNTNWQNTLNNTWYGNFGNPYAMWSIYKGLDITIGLNAGTGAISNLHTNPGDINNPNHGWNWWEDYCNWLVTNQNANGSWSGDSYYWTGPLSTAWGVSILSGAIVAPTPTRSQAVPTLTEWGMIIFMVFAGLGSVYYLRRQRRA
jgi:Prenyltransferase and squalene oxidase repeat